MHLASEKICSSQESNFQCLASKTTALTTELRNEYVPNMKSHNVNFKCALLKHGGKQDNKTGEEFQSTVNQKFT